MHLRKLLKALFINDAIIQLSPENRYMHALQFTAAYLKGSQAQSLLQLGFCCFLNPKGHFLQDPNQGRQGLRQG